MTEAWGVFCLTFLLFGWSVTGTRVAYVLLSIFSAAFPGILVYLILWLLLPADD